MGKTEIRFTAADARQLAGPTVDEKVDNLLKAIKNAATNKKRSLKTGWEYKEDEELWVRGGYDTSKEWIKAKNILTELGYKVTFYYQVHSIAVDMYTLIEW